MLKRLPAVCASAAFAMSSLFAQTLRFPLKDATGLAAPDVRLEAVSYLGRKCIRMTVGGADRAGVVLLPGTGFQDGVIDADIALRATTPPGMRYPGFVGIAFRVRPDRSHYEAFYLRPGNADAADQLMRNHAVQYVSEPDFGWYRLRREWPSVYESGARLAFETWTHVRIEVTGRKAKLFLNGSTKPALTVDGLRGEDLRGGVALWSYTDEEAYFSNVEIRHAAPEKTTNGSDVAGSWEMQYATDAGGGIASMELHREANHVTGQWSGPLGNALPVDGTWRDGYVELSFTGEWPSGSRQGAPGAVRTFLAGWVDGDAAKGRIRVVARADGIWVAKRKT